VAAIAALVGCSGPAVCTGDVGPETLEVDASALVGESGVPEVEVCIVVNAEYEMGRQEFCSPPEVPMVGLTVGPDDYPKVLGYYVDLLSGSSHVFPENGSGTFEMTCTATTNRIVLPVAE
jgi:hypothetical protein